jgi:hypothetical protein
MLRAGEGKGRVVDELGAVRAALLHELPNSPPRSPPFQRPCSAIPTTGAAAAPAPCRGRSSRLVVQAKKTKPADAKKQPGVQYGADWYTQTREAAKPRRTVREEMGAPAALLFGEAGARGVGWAGCIEVSLLTCGRLLVAASAPLPSPPVPLLPTRVPPRRQPRRQQRQGAQGSGGWPSVAAPSKKSTAGQSCCGLFGGRS